MEIADVMKRRYACRVYAKDPVPAEALQRILFAAHVAPSAHNYQPVRLIAVQTEDGHNKLNKAAHTYGAPLAIIVCADRDIAWTRVCDGKQSCDIDASIVTDHMMLQATEDGLATVWICDFKPDILTQVFELPENLKPINILAVGYSENPGADPQRHTHTRLPLDQIVTFR